MLASPSPEPAQVPAGRKIGGNIVVSQKIKVRAMVLIIQPSRNHIFTSVMNLTYTICEWKSV